MQTAVCFLVVCCLGMALAEGEVPECPGFTEEQLTQLKSLAVTEDIHEELFGEHHELWGPKIFQEGDKDACVKYTWTKVDDTHLTMELYGKGAWFTDGEVTRNLTAEKVENGVYLLRRDNGEVAYKEYHLSNKEHVRAVFSCSVQVSAPGSKEAAFSRFSAILVPSNDKEISIETDVQAEVSEFVKKVQDHKDLLGEIVKFTNVC